MILEAQRIQIAKAMDDQEAKVEGRFQEVDRKFGAEDDKMAKIQAQLADLTKELREAPRSITASTGGWDLPDKYRWTLVYGGWERETRKGTILRELDQVLAQLHVDADLDGMPWTSGARRSNAFSNFQLRRGERVMEQGIACRKSSWPSRTRSPWWVVGGSSRHGRSHQKSAGEGRIAPWSKRSLGRWMNVRWR